MDFFTKHFLSTPRRMKASPTVASIGHVKKTRKSVVNHPFQSINFSFVLEGSGFYVLDGMRHPVQAPKLIHQWPDAHMHYGPDETWVELFFVYPKAHLDDFIAMGLFRPGEWGYPLLDEAELKRSLPSFLQCLLHEESADVIDLRSLEFLLKSRLPPKGGRSRHHPVVQEALHRMARELEQPFSLEDFLKETPISSSSFRRYWARTMKEAPHGHHLNLRLNEAARRLAETDDRISTISHQIGIDDPLYFSRRFRKRFRLSPREYRHRFNPNLPQTGSPGMIDRAGGT